MISSSSSVSCGVSTAVGSSRMRIWASLTRALMISTRCCTPTGRSSTRASGSTSRLYFCDSSSTWLRAPSMSRNAPLVSSWPSITFSATVKTGTSMKCWWTMPIPASIASPGSWKCTSWPSMRILPSSGRYRPNRVFISVDFPAPFSPSRQWISPGSMTRSIESFAVKVPNRLVIPCSSSRTLLPPTPGVDCSHTSDQGASNSCSGSGDSPCFARDVTKPPGAGRGGLRRAIRECQLPWGEFVDSTLMVPSMICALSSSILVVSSAGTFDSKSWYGARPTPSLASVPMYGVLV